MARPHFLHQPDVARADRPLDAGGGRRSPTTPKSSIMRSSMKAEPYLSINPMGKVPAIVHNGKVVTEVAAICAYLADAFPEAGLAPARRREGRLLPLDLLHRRARSKRRSATRPRAGSRRPNAQRMFGYGNYDLAIDTLEEPLAGRDYVCGDRFTAADLLCRREGHFMLAVRHCSSRRPVFTDYAERHDRPRRLPPRQGRSTAS